MAFNMSRGTLSSPVLNCVRASSDSVTSGSSNNWHSNPIGGLTINCQNSSNLILILYSACVSANIGANDQSMRLLRNGSEIQRANNGRNLLGAFQSSFIASNFAGSNCTCIFWDEPGSTGNMTYTVQHRPQTGGGGTMYFNATNATGGGDSWGSRSFMTLMEIGDV